MSVVKIRNDQEREFLIGLLKEFASKGIRSRKIILAADHEHFTIAEITVSGISDDEYYRILMPDYYVKFFNYLIEKNFRQ